MCLKTATKACKTEHLPTAKNQKLTLLKFGLSDCDDSQSQSALVAMSQPWQRKPHHPVEFVTAKVQNAGKITELNELSTSRESQMKDSDIMKTLKLLRSHFLFPLSARAEYHLSVALEAHVVRPLKGLCLLTLLEMTLVGLESMPHNHTLLSQVLLSSL